MHSAFSLREEDNNIHHTKGVFILDYNPHHFQPNPHTPPHTLPKKITGLVARRHGDRLSLQSLFPLAQSHRRVYSSSHFPRCIALHLNSQLAVARLPFNCPNRTRSNAKTAAVICLGAANPISVATPALRRRRWNRPRLVFLSTRASIACWTSSAATQRTPFLFSRRCLLTPACQPPGASLRMLRAPRAEIDLSDGSAELDWLPWQ